MLVDLILRLAAAPKNELKALIARDGTDPQTRALAENELAQRKQFIKAARPRNAITDVAVTAKEMGRVG